MLARRSPPPFALRALTSKGQVKLAEEYTLCGIRVVYEVIDIIPIKQLKKLIEVYDRSERLSPVLPEVELPALWTDWQHKYNTLQAFTAFGHGLHLTICVE